jgi:hypothetical protein
MGNILLDGLIHILQAAISGVTHFLATLLTALLAETTADATLPWVASAVRVTEELFVSLLALRVLYVAVTHYILWSEGNGDTDGAVVVKGILRAVAFGFAGSFVALTTFRFGADVAIRLLADPLAQSSALLGSDAHKIETIANLSLGLYFVATVAFAVAVVLIAIVTVQMAIRAAELVIYMIAAPIVALGQLSPDGGAWSGWWRGLVILSMTTALQWLCIEGMVGSVQAITGAGLATSASLDSAALLSVAWGVVAVMGSHLLKQWGEAHTGARQAVGVGLRVATRGLVS